MNSIVTETILIECQALVANAMQAIDSGHEGFAHTCLERTYNNLTKLINGDK
jgi:hypothetical protein